MTDRFPDFLNPAIDSSGNTISGARLFFYRVGTSTKKNTYSDSAKTIANANPVVADSGGRFGDIFMLTDEQYKVVLAPAGIDDPPSSPLDTWDNFSPVPSNPIANITVISKSSDYTALAGDKGNLIEVDASSGPVVITLLPAATATNGFYLYVKKIDSSTNTVTVDADGSETIDGALTAILSVQYDIVGVDTDGTKWSRLNNPGVPRPSAGDAGSSLVVDNAGTYVINPVATPARNVIINPDFNIAQRGTSFTAATTPANNDDTYLLDRWVLLSDGNDRADIAKETTVVPTGSPSSVKFTVATVGGTSEKFGLLQVIEAADAANLIGGAVSLSFSARTTGSQVENVRAHVLSWDGTADTVTSDVVSTWGAEGSNPTFVLNWTAENVATSLALSDTFQTLRIENISIDTAGAKNVAVFIHVDDTDLVNGDVLYVSDVQLVRSPIALPVVKKSVLDELAACQRFYAKTFPQATAPAANTGVTGALMIRAVTGGDFAFTWQFPHTMRTTPTLTTYNPSTTGSAWRNTSDGTNTTNSSSGISDARVTLGGGNASDALDLMAIHVAADAEL